MSTDENNSKPTSPLGANKYKKPISWTPGAKVTNSSNLASSPEKSDSEYAPKDDLLTADPSNEIDPISLLKEKKSQRKNDTQDSAEKETEYHPTQSNPEKLTKPEFKKTPAPKEETDDANEEEDASTDSPAPVAGKKSTTILFYILFLILLGGIGVTAWKLDEQKKNRPPSTYELVKESLNSVKQTNKELKEKLTLVNEADLAKARLAMATQNVANNEEILKKQDEQQVAFIQQIMAKQEEMVAYYKRYRAYTQRMAKGMYVAEIQTKSGRIFTEVTITKCAPSEISIMHSSGATRIPVNDLPDPILDRLAYTNPFSDVANALKQTKEALARVGMAGAATAPIPTEPLPAPSIPATVSAQDTPTPPASQGGEEPIPAEVNNQDEDIPYDLPPAL